jgi:hypothetical protein
MGEGEGGGEGENKLRKEKGKMMSVHRHHLCTIQHD